MCVTKNKGLKNSNLFLVLSRLDQNKEEEEGATTSTPKHFLAGINTKSVVSCCVCRCQPTLS
jgi:hypothetical protein